MYCCCLSDSRLFCFLNKMKFKFCGDADCPDWVLAEINTISKMSSIKLKLLAQVVANGIVNSSIDREKAEKLFEDSKLDVQADLEACIACIAHIIKSTIRFNCDSTALHTELQQLGLPRELSTSIKRVVDEYGSEIASYYKSISLKVNALQNVQATVEKDSNCVKLDMKIGDDNKQVLLTPRTLDVLLENLIYVKTQMTELQNNPYVLYK